MEPDEYFEGFMEGLEQASATTEVAVSDATWRLRRSWCLLTEDDQGAIRWLAPKMVSALNELIGRFGRA